MAQRGVAQRDSAIRGKSEPGAGTGLLDKWAAWLGSAVCFASLGLVALANLGWFQPTPAFAVLGASIIAAAILWRPPIVWSGARPGWSALVAATILLIGGILIAPGSENIGGPRDPGVYVATGGAIGRYGGTLIVDPGLQLLAATVDPSQVNAWIYQHAVNQARIRFPAQFFIHDISMGTVEGGFLPVVPVWMALAASVGGMEPALHLAGAFGILALVYVMLASHAAAVSPSPQPSPAKGEGAQVPLAPVRERASAPSPSFGDERATFLRRSGAEGAPTSLSPSNEEPPPFPPPRLERVRERGISGFVSPSGAEPGNDARPPSAPLWPLVGAFLAVTFPQVWWAREPMAESALGAFAWMVAWASVCWLKGGGWRWGMLAGLGTVCALFARADGILVLVALVLIAIAFAAPGRATMLLIALAGAVAAVLHYALLAPTYMSMTYGPFTASRAAVGLAALAVVVGALGLVRSRGWLDRRFFSIKWGAGMIWRQREGRSPPDDSEMGEKTPAHTNFGAWAWRAALLSLVALGTLAAVSGVAPGAGRDSSLGAPSPLAWLPGYVPWPVIILAAFGLIAIAWSGAPRQLVPLLLVGGLPALLYLPDPLVTGDHPWMTRRLVPAVIPLVAIAASVGAAALWRLDLPRIRSRVRFAGRLIAALLVGLGLGLAVAQDGDLVGPRHGSGVIDGLTALVADLPPAAVVIFPAGPAGLHLAMPILATFGIDSFAIPESELTPAVASTLTRMEALGREVYWAEEGRRPVAAPQGLTVVPFRTSRIRYSLADYGRRPPPLELTEIDHVVTLYRITAQ